MHPFIPSPSYLPSLTHSVPRMLSSRYENSAQRMYPPPHPLPHSAFTRIPPPLSITYISPLCPICSYYQGTKNPAQCMDLDPSSPMMLHLVPRGKKLNMGGPALGPGLAPGPGLDSDRAKPSALVLPLTPGFTIHSVCAFEKHEEIAGAEATTAGNNGANQGVTRDGDDRGNDGGKKYRHTLELYTTAWESSAVSSGKVKGGLLGSWEGEMYLNNTSYQHILSTHPLNLHYQHILSTHPINPFYQ